MVKINIIGTGNVATHLLKAFAGKAETVSVNPRSLEGFDSSADFSIIAVSDNAIREVAEAIPSTDGIIAHTSGTTPADILAFKGIRTGVFYPLQTFSKNSELDYSHIPFFVESKDPSTQDSLAGLASMISDSVTIADSHKRKALHVASVFACNFANHMWTIADKILRDNGMNFEVLQPLLSETLRKTQSIPPAAAQTGPAARNDSKTIDSHLEFLGKDEDLAKLYSMITSSIMNSSKLP